MRVRLVLNTKSRRGAQDADLVRGELAAAGVEIVEGSTRARVDAIVAAGGDGTIVSLVDDAMAADLPLGIVPLGTFNDLAKTLGIPLDVRAACEVIASGYERRIDVGRVNGTYFVNEASIGLSTRIARKQTPEVKQRFGFLGVVAITLQAIAQGRSFHVLVDYDGKTEHMRTVQLTVANSGHFGGFVQKDDATIDDGWLDLYSFDVRNPLQALRVAAALQASRRIPTDGLRMLRSTRFAVHARWRHHIAADGEPAGFTPATFEVLPQALRVLVLQPGHDAL
jgi:diacylglycerol kinase (ATP)